jgi:hypothetical protein
MRLPLLAGAGATGSLSEGATATMAIPVGPTSLDLPAWVQAVGSVAAIVVAVAISRRDTIIRRREERSRRVQLALYVASVSDTALADLENEFSPLLKEGYEFVGEITVQLRLLSLGARLAMHRLEAISPIDWPSLQMWQAYFKWEIALEAVITASDMFAAHADTDNNGVEILLEGCEELMKQARESALQISAEAKRISKIS